MRERRASHPECPGLPLAPCFVLAVCASWCCGVVAVRVVRTLCMSLHTHTVCPSLHPVWPHLSSHALWPVRQQLVADPFPLGTALVLLLALLHLRDLDASHLHRRAICRSAPRRRTKRANLAAQTRRIALTCWPASVGTTARVVFAHRHQLAHARPLRASDRVPACPRQHEIGLGPLRGIVPWPRQPAPPPAPPAAEAAQQPSPVGEAACVERVGPERPLGAHL